MLSAFFSSTCNCNISATKNRTNILKTYDCKSLENPASECLTLIVKLSHAEIFRDLEQKKCGERDGLTRGESFL